jgi:hypothetical protein
MTKEQWVNFYLQITKKYLQKSDQLGLASPENWLQHREIGEGFNKEVDELTNVYNMERK